MLYIIQTALQLGCVYSFVALALFLSYRILDIADLTTDGCFVLGMAVSVSCCAGGHPVAGVILGMIAGGMCWMRNGNITDTFGSSFHSCWHCDKYWAVHN